MSFQSRLELIVDSRSGEQRLRAFESQLDKTQGAGGRLAEGMSVLKIALGAAAAAAGGFSVGRVVTETAAFEQSLLKLQVVSGATTTQLAAMEDQARSLGATSMFSARQAADAQNFLAMAGMSVNEVLSATPGILQLATAGQMDLAHAADLASNVLGGLRLEVSELGRVNDVLTLAASKSNTNISQLGDALSYAAPLAATAGISLEETAAAIGALSDAGLQSTRAGTGLLGVIRQLSNLTPNATAALSNYGLTASEVNIEQEGLLAVLDRLQQANINTADSFRIFGSEAGPAAQILAATSQKVTDLTNTLQDAEGAAASAALRLGSGLEGAMRSLNSAIGESVLQLGRDSGMSGALQEVIGSATGVISVYNGMLPQFQEANQLTDEQARNLERIATTVSLTTGAVGGLTAAYVSLTAASWAAHAAQTALLRIMRANPILLAAGAVATLSGALYTARNRTIEFGDTQATVLDWMNGAWSASAEVFSKNWDGAVTSAIGMFEAMAEPVGGVANYLWATFQSLMTNLGNITKNTTNAIIAYFNTIGDVMAIVADAIWNQYANAFDKTLNLARGFWQDLEAVFSGDFSFGNFQAALNTEIVDPLSGAASRIQAAFDENLSTDYVGDVFGTIGEGAQFVADDFTALGERISEAAFIARMSRNGFGEVAEGFSEGKTQSQLLKEELDKLNQSLADPASEEAAKAAKTLAENFESLKRTLDPSYSSLMDFWEGIELLNKSIDTTTIEGMTEYNRLVALLTKRYAEATKGSDDAKKAMERLTQQYDSAHSRAQQLSKDLSAINEAWRNDPANGDQYARMVAGVREEMAELAAETDEMGREFERFGNVFDDTMVDMIMGATDGFETIEKAGKRMIAELLWAASKNEIRIRLGMDASGPMKGGFGQLFGTGSGDGIGSLISGGRTLLGLGSTAATTGGAALSGGFMGAAATQSAGSLYGMAATGGVAQASLMSSITSGISAAMPWLAGGFAIDNILGLGITDGITKAISGLFGGSPTKFSGRFGTTSTNDPSQYMGSGKDGVFEHQDDGTNFYGQSALGYTGFLDRGTERLQRAGVGEGKNWAEELTNASVQMDNLVASIASSPAELEAMRSAVQGLEASSGNAAELIEFALNERPRAALEALGGTFGEFVRGLSGNLEEVVQQAQFGQQAYSALAGSMQRLNLQFDAAGAGAYGAASNIATLVGGTENLSTLLTGYYDAFHTEEEKFENLASDLSGTFSEMGRELPTTREGVRSVVESLQLMGEAGQEQLATILQLNQPLNQYITALEEQRRAAEGSTGAIEDNSDALRAQEAIARERESLERQLLGLLGDETELRRRDLAAIDESNRSLQQRIWYINDENDVVTEAMRRQEERNQAIERESTAMAQARQQLASFGVTINDWLNNLQGTEQGLGTPADQLAATSQAFEEQYAKALAGDQAALGSITQYADRFIEAQKGWSASGDQTVSTIDRVSGMLEALPEKLSAEQFLANEFRDALGQQTTDLLAGQEEISDRLGRDFATIDLSGESLIDWSEFRAAFSGLAEDSTLRQIFGALDNNGSGAIDKLEAISNGTQSLVDYWAGQQSQDVQGAIAQISEMYQQALSREPDLPGLQYWVDQWLSGASMGVIRDSINQHAGSGSAGGSAGGSSAGGGASTGDSGSSRTPRPFWERVASAQMSDLERQSMSNFQAFNSVSEAQSFAAIRGINIPAYASGAWNLQSDQLAKVHQNEFIAPAAGGIADEFRAYAAGNYHAELMGEMQAMRKDVSAAPLPQFPLLNTQDVTQVMRDMQQTIERQGQQLAALLQQGNQHTGQTRDAVISGNGKAAQQREQTNRELNKLNRKAKLELRT